MVMDVSPPDGMLLFRRFRSSLKHRCVSSPPHRIPWSLFQRLTFSLYHNLHLLRQMVTWEPL